MNRMTLCARACGSWAATGEINNAQASARPSALLSPRISMGIFRVCGGNAAAVLGRPRDEYITAGWPTARLQEGERFELDKARRGRRSGHQRGEILHARRGEDLLQVERAAEE